MQRRCFIVVLVYWCCCHVVWGQDLSTLNYDIHSAMQTNTIYDLHFSSDSFLYVATNKGLWKHNGITFQEIIKEDGESLEGSYLRERLGMVYMQDFRGQLYQVVADTLCRQSYPTEIKDNIVGVYLGEKYIYYVSTHVIYVYDYKGQKKSELTYPHAGFDHSITSGGMIAMIVVTPERKRVQHIAQLKRGQLIVGEGQWDPKFEHDYNGTYLIKDHKNKQIYTRDKTLFVDWSNSPHDIEPWRVRKVANTILVGCGNGLYIPNANRLVLRGKSVTDIVEDSEGNIWIGTVNKGLHKLTSLENNFYPIEGEEKAVHLIHERKDTLIYADVASNLYYYDGKKFKRFFKALVRSNPKNLYFDEAYQLYVYSGNYCQTFRANLKPHTLDISYGKYIQDGEGAAFVKPLIAPLIRYSKLPYFYEYNQYNGEIVPDTLYYGLRYHVKGFLGKMHLIKFNTSFKSEAVYKWKKQLIYYSNDTLYYDDLETYTTTYKVPISGNFQAVEVFNERVYVQTKAHLNEYDLEGNLINTIARKDGLEKKIIHFVADEKYICMTTKEAVYILEASSWQLLYKYTAQNGIISIDFTKAWIYNDYLYVNGSEGVTKIKLGKAHYNQGAPSLELTSVLVDGRSIRTNQFSYKQNNLEINLVVRSFTATGKLFWRLNGKEWRLLEGKPQIVLDGLQYGNYQIEAYWQNDLGATSKQLKYTFTIHRPFWLEVWFIALLMGVGLVIGMLYYRRRVKQIQAQNQLKNNLIASQMTALKSQMNPHFIFNALNSIQSLIIYKRTDEAYDYVDKFAVLLRQTLNFSDQDFIALDAEVEMLQNYLDMENMRFDGQLEVLIEPCEDMDIQIPSMLIQPFVENAIKHGLLHKTEGQRRIEVRFKLVDDETLICEVIDNGIGRKAAQTLRIEDKRFGKPFSTGATQKRLELLQKTQFKRLGLAYTDLEDENGNSLGTKVTITIPIE